MQQLKSQDLRNLIQTQPYPCISIYMGLGDSPEERFHALSRFRKHVHSADVILGKSNLGRTKPVLFESFGNRAINSLKSISDNVKSVALFRSFQTAALFPIHHKVSEIVAVADSFHLKPLLSTMQNQDKYFCVVFNYRRICLYRGNEHCLVKVASFDAAESFNDENLASPQPRWRRGMFYGKNPNYAISRSHSSGEAEDFVRHSATAIAKHLENQSAPVVLVGSPLMRRFYRAACGHSKLQTEEVTAPVHVNDVQTIHKLTWPIVQSELARSSAHVTSTYNRLRNTPHVSDELSKIAKDCVSGRVSDILISKDDKIFGRLDRSRGHITELRPQANKVGDDVLCDLAQEVMRHGGASFLLPKSEMPTTSPVAALFRW